MTWQNPWAWAGLATIALPILIHLLGQQRARRHLFPTLRFLGDSRPLPTRRTRLHDLLLLAVRISILVAAVAALALPRLNTAARLAAADHTLVRAVIIDNSASMLRRSSSGEPALVVAQRIAAAVADSAQRHLLLVASDPAAAIPGAVAWLQRQSGRAQLVIVSDFQRGVVEPADVAVIPERIGVQLIPVVIAPAADPIAVRTRQGNRDVLADVTPLPDGNGIEWRSDASARASSPRLLALAGPDEAAGAAAAAQAARSVAVELPLDTIHAVAIVYPHAAERAGLLKNARPVPSAWAAELLVRLAADSLLVSAAATATPIDSIGASAAFVVVRTRNGRAVVVATEANLKGIDQLVLAPLADAGSLTAAALIAAVTRALSLAPPTGELDSRIIADSSLTHWQRPIGAAAGNGSDASDGRWLWLLVLGLLGSEWLLRRQMTPQGVVEAA